MRPRVGRFSKTGQEDPMGATLGERYYTPGQCARDIYAVLGANVGSLPVAQREVVPILNRLAQEKNLLEIGLPRDGNHVSQSNWLYYDGEIGIITAKCPHDVGVPVHNHGTWEVVGVYKGELEYRLFNRVDDGSRDGYAELRIVEDGVLRAGEFSVCPLPPHDIHGFRARNDDTWMIAVVHGEFAEERLYFDPEKKSYIRRNQKAWRRSLGR
jgi:predicted metal-dependent enzyme (double-stranded beta helix superfamily)